MMKTIGRRGWPVLAVALALAAALLLPSCRDAYQVDLSPYKHVDTDAMVEFSHGGKKLMVGACEVTYGLWHRVLESQKSSYTVANKGKEGADGAPGAKPTDYTNNDAVRPLQDSPVVGISYKDVVVWLNAYSASRGKTPVYKVDSSEVKTTSSIQGSKTITADESADGYRLLTKSQFEELKKGAEGATIVANDGSTEMFPALVGSRPADSRGLYDIAGNAGEFLCCGSATNTVTVAGLPASAASLADFDGTTTATWSETSDEWGFRVCYYIKE